MRNYFVYEQNECTFINIFRFESGLIDILSTVQNVRKSGIQYIE